MPATSTSLILAPSGAPIAFTSASATGADHATRFFSPNSPFSGEGGSSVRSSSLASMPAPASANPALRSVSCGCEAASTVALSAPRTWPTDRRAVSSTGASSCSTTPGAVVAGEAAGAEAAGASSAGSSAVSVPVPKSASVISLLAVPSARQ